MYPGTYRLVSWLAITATFCWKTSEMISRGWSAVGDDATISIRSYDSLSGKGTLLGLLSQLSGISHPVYHPGPLEYWLLALPVRFGGHYGTLWGAALFCTLAAIVAAEAVRAARGPQAQLVATVLILGVVAWVPPIAENPVWNPYMGLMFLLAAIGAAFAVLCGKPGWWPVVVVSGSIATQCHLVFALASVLLVIVAGVVAAIRSVRRRQGSWWENVSWLVIGLSLGVACWLAPLIQQFSDHPGNLSAIISAELSQHGLGLAFGLRALSATTLPHPLWLAASNPAAVTVIQKSSPLWGVVVLFVLGATAVLAPRRRAYDLGALAAIAFCLDIALVVSFSGVPAGKAFKLLYLKIVMYPPGIVTWSVFVWFTTLGVRYLVARWRNGAGSSADQLPRASQALIDAPLAVTQPVPAGVGAVAIGVDTTASAGGGGPVSDSQLPAAESADAEPGGDPPAQQSGRGAGQKGLAVLVGLATATVLVAAVAMNQFDALHEESPTTLMYLHSATSQIEHLVPRGPVALEFEDKGGPYGFTTDDGQGLNGFLLMAGVVWQLKQDGWSPRGPGVDAVYFGPGYLAHRGMRHALVILTATRLYATSGHPRHPGG
jgi:hypothetical protein